MANTIRIEAVGTRKMLKKLDALPAKIRTKIVRSVMPAMVISHSNEMMAQRRQSLNSMPWITVNVLAISVKIAAVSIRNMTSRATQSRPIM